MARYVQFTSGADVYLVSEDHSIYGSSRVGLNTRRDTLYKNTTQSVSSRQSGLKHYELINHLGNVLVTVADQKKPNSAGGITIDNFDPVIVSISDYYPFGAGMPGRTYINKAYRYRFNGKEKDFETGNDNYGFELEFMMEG
jgi:hypothetical protein